jgi:hypothetical protein
MNDKPPKKELIRQEILKLIEKDPKAKDFIVEVGSERVSVSSLLADLLMDEDRLIQFLRELARDTMPFESTLTRMSGRGVEVLAGQPFYLEPIRHLGSHTVGMEHFLVAMVSGPAGKRRLVKALARIKVRQVKFECSLEFYKRLMDEKLQRNLTVQQLAVRALERYLAVPESIHRSIEEEAEITSTPLPNLLKHLMQHLSTFIHRPELAEECTMAAEAVQLRSALEAVQHYLEQLPPEKVHLVRQSLAMDLKYYRSSRHKRPAQRKGTPEAGSAESEGDD